MANTYTQIHLQFVFAVKYRDALIKKEWQENSYRYITGIIQQNKHKVLQINGMPDHIHILAGVRPEQSVSSLIQNVKTESTKWINAGKFSRHNFAWQDGFGAFSYDKSQVPDVILYIQNQENHHRKQTFLDEYRQFMDVFGIEWEERYIFTDPQ